MYQLFNPEGKAVAGTCSPLPGGPMELFIAINKREWGLSAHDLNPEREGYTVRPVDDSTMTRELRQEQGFLDYV